MALVDGMIRAARLDTSLYEEVERDTTETQNALIVVVAAALASGIALALSGAVDPIGALVGGVVSSVVNWAIVGGFVYLIGTRLFGGTATWGEVLRTLGYASSAGVITILGVIPLVGWLAYPVAFIWVLIASVIAIRQALDVGNGRAIASAVIGWIIGAIVASIILGVFGISRMMPPSTMPTP
jgi:hypothetical protein